jgi:flagellar hook-associated protein 1 FlgK
VGQSIDEIAAGTTGLPGDNSIALALSGLRSARLATLGGVSLNERLTVTVGELGTDVRQADQQAASLDTLVSNVDAQRESVHGVSIDEEMVALITHQQAYAAAARMVSVADEMMDDILRLV